MANRQRVREAVSDFNQEKMQSRLAEGWRLVAVEWERDLPAEANTAQPSPRSRLG
jgi:hypothetical protein